MRRLIICILMGLLTGWHAAVAQGDPPQGQPRGPQDRALAGTFSPDRVKADEESAAQKAIDSGTAPFNRGRRFYFSWNLLSPAEFEALNRHTVFLVSVWTRKPEDLPVKRIYHRVEGQDSPITKVSSWRTPVDEGSATAKMYGANREDGFYLVPGGAMLRKGQLIMDLPNQNGWMMLELPSNVATADARRFPNPDPRPNAKPDLKQLQAFIRRRFPGFPVPQSVP